MRNGGTLKGMEELMKEFGAEVVAKGVFIETNHADAKQIDNYISLIHVDTRESKRLYAPIKKFFHKETTLRGINEK